MCVSVTCTTRDVRKILTTSNLITNFVATDERQRRFFKAPLPLEELFVGRDDEFISNLIFYFNKVPLTSRTR